MDEIVRIFLKNWVPVDDKFVVFFWSKSKFWKYILKKFSRILARDNKSC